MSLRGLVSISVLVAALVAATGAFTAQAAGVQTIVSVGAEAEWAHAGRVSRVVAERNTVRTAEGRVYVEERLRLTSRSCDGCPDTVEFSGRRINGQPTDEDTRSFSVVAEPSASAVLVSFESDYGCTSHLRFFGSQPSVYAAGPDQRGPSSVAAAGVDRGGSVDGSVCFAPFPVAGPAHLWSNTYVDRF